MVYIFDITYAESIEDLLKSESISDEEFNEECIEAFCDIDTATEELLNRFYEVQSDYGNPIESLLRYISADDKRKILSELHYLIGESEEEVRKKWDEYVATGPQPIE